MPANLNAVLTGPTSASVNVPVAFDGSGSTAPGGVETWQLTVRPQTDPLPPWVVVAEGVGAPPSAINVTFTEPASTQVVLTITDKQNRSDSATVNVSVS